MSAVFDDLRRLFAPDILPAADFLSQRQTDDMVLDVRTAAEYGAGHLAGAVHMDVSASDFRVRASQLDLARPIFLYCQSGSRSGSALQILRSLGASQAHNIGSLATLVRADADVQPTPL